jgi:hypothetical protein
MTTQQLAKVVTYAAAFVLVALASGFLYTNMFSAAALDYPQGYTDSAPQVGRQMQQTVDPCENLGGDLRLTTGYNAPYYDYTIEDYVLQSHVVSRAVISVTESARFETIDGLPPGPATPTPQPTSTPDPYSDDPDDYVPGQILSPIVLQATNIYSGTSVAGYVVARWGGTASSCPDYIHHSPDDLMTGVIGDEGIAFMVDPPVEWVMDPPDWFTHLVSTANSISTPSNVYKPMLIWNWHLYDPNSGNAATKLDGEQLISITQLESDVQQAVP